MATTLDYAEFVCDQIHGVGEIRYKKMFGEYMVYVNDKPILLLCDNTVFVKMLDCISDIMAEATIGIPYCGAKPSYMLDIENRELAIAVIQRLEPVIPIPKPRKPKTIK